MGKNEIISKDVKDIKIDTVITADDAREKTDRSKPRIALEKEAQAEQERLNLMKTIKDELTLVYIAIEKATQYGQNNAKVEVFSHELVVEAVQQHLEKNGYKATSRRISYPNMDMIRFTIQW